VSAKNVSSSQRVLEGLTPARNTSRFRPGELRAHVLYAAVSTVLAIALLPTWTDPDLWGHVRFGLDLLRDHHLPRIDPYSFTQDRPWINHEWLSEALSAMAYAGLGTFGLALLKAAVIGAALIMLDRALTRASAAARLITIGIVLWAAVGITLTVRPQIWSFLLMAVLCRRLLTCSAGEVWELPLIFLAWANLHGGWIVGFGVLIVWTMSRCALGPPGRQCMALVAAALCSAAITLVNPYGWGLWRFLADTVRLARTDIVEWQPLWRTNISDWFPWLATVAAVLVMAARTAKRTIAEPLAVAALLAYASIRVARLVPFFALTSAILWSPHLVRLWPSPKADDRRRGGSDAVGAALLVAILGVVGYVAIPVARCLPIVGEWSPDRAAAAALRASAARGRLITWFGWGEYALWHLSPNLKVSIDGRRETVYSDDVLRRHLAIYEDRSEGFVEIEHWQPEYVWLPVQVRSTKTWLADHGYRIDIETPRSYVAVRRDLPRLTTAPPLGPACFPG
jgi:hypothetical protein